MHRYLKVMRNLVFLRSSSRISKRPRSPSLQSSTRDICHSALNGVNFLIILPIELIYPILSHLSVRDLIQCFMVCQTWSHIISQWPVFWDRLRMTMPKSDCSLANAVAHGSSEQVRLVGPMARPLSIDLLRMLWHAKYCGSLVLDRLDLSSFDVNTGIYMSLVLSKHTSLVDLRISDCMIDASLAVGIFAGATHLKYLTIEKTSVEDDVSSSGLKMSAAMFMGPSPLQQPSLKQEDKTEQGQWDQQLEREQPVPSLIAQASCTGLTRIKISLVDHKEDNKALYRLLERALKNCSNLVSLYLDANDPGNHTRCVYNAAKASRLLRICVVSPGCVVPAQGTDTLLDWQDYIEATERNPKIYSGLKVLVFTGNWLGRRGDLRTIVAKHHRTLEFVYLFYDNDAIRPNVLCDLGSSSCGALRLRELRLSTEKSADPSGGTPSWLSIERSLAILLAKCPSLESLQITCDFGHISDRLQHYLRLDARALRAMVKGTPRLRRLELLGLTDMPIAEDIIDIVNGLPALKNFKFATYCGVYPNCRVPQEILRQRGGFLRHRTPRHPHTQAQQI
ncbi:hypothetical protein BX666DRAFT_509653 [Dichotomocladium elegans]|nr:hypothetical protein BX666DRAFT_509653 [Dichotomocladium elegans]